MSIQDCPPVNPVPEISGIELPAPRQGDNPEIEERPRAIGKIITAVDSENFTRLSVEALEQNPTPFGDSAAPIAPLGIPAPQLGTRVVRPKNWVNYNSDSRGVVDDRFRYESRSFWRTVFSERGDRRVILNQFEYCPDSAFKRNGRQFIANDSLSFKVNIVGNTRTWDVSQENEGDILDGFFKRQTLYIEANQRYFPNATLGPFPGFSKEFWDYWVNGGNIEVPLGEEGVAFIGPLFETGRTFLDHTFIMTAPMYPKELENIIAINKPSIGIIEAEYNFRISNYEDSLSRIARGQSENVPLLPNMYTFLLEGRNPQENNLDFQQHITLLNRIKDVGENEKGEYFDKWSREYNRIHFDTPREIQRLNNKFKRIILSSNDIDILNSYNEKRFLFPMYVDLQFSTDRQNIIADAIKQAQLTTSLINAMSLDAIEEEPNIQVDNVALGNRLRGLRGGLRGTGGSFSYDQARNSVDNQINPAPPSQQRNSLVSEDIRFSPPQTSPATPQEGVEEIHRPITKQFHFATQIVSNIDIPRITVGMRSNQRTKILDINKWWRSFRDTINLDQNSIFEDSVLLSTSLPEIFTSSDQQYNFVKSILTLIFSGKLRETIKNRLRTFEEIMRGTPAYSETIFYKIAKYRTTSVGYTVGDPIQEIFVPNTSDLDIFRYIDTQVAYGEGYLYNVHAYELVFGTQYEYRTVQNQETFVLPDSPYALAEVFLSPSIQLVEVPFFMSARQTVIDKPPMPPNINIIPYKNVDNQILFNVDTVVGETVAHPIIINDSDNDQILKIRRARDLEEDEPIEFKTDDIMESIEVYRITSKPKSYSDFSNGLHQTISSDIADEFSLDYSSDLESQYLPSVSFIDDILPNVKYYYTIRAIDFRGHFSNPSPVYLVEMISRDGVNFPRIKIVDFEEEDRERSTITMKKYIKISPSVLQKSLNVSNIDEIRTAGDAEVTLGSGEESLFARHPNKNKIKVRLTSKLTGKKIDFNLNFTHKHDQ